MQVTLVPDAAKADGKPVVSVVAPVTISGTSTVAFASAQQVFVVGGTVQTTVSFAGSVQTGIGNVKIEDADGNYAVVPEAGVAKTGATKALVVQHIDDAGIPFRQATQVSILNNQGTLATSAYQVSANSQGAAILNNQGTLATSAYQVAASEQLSALLNAQGTQSTAALATNATSEVISNNQGTLATSALQSAANNMLAVIMNGQGTVADSAAELNMLRVVMNNQGTQASSALQTTGNATLTAIMNNQGTLAPGAALGKTQLVANDGVTLIESDIDSAGDQHLGVRMVQAIYASVKNTYGSNLSAGAVFYGTTETTLGVAGIQTMLKTNQICTVYVDQSGDSGTNWDVVDTYTFRPTTGGGGASWTTQAVGDTFRIRVANTGTAATSYFRMATALCPTVEAVPRAVNQNGNFQVAVNELLPNQFGPTSGVKSSPLGKLVITPSNRLVGASFGNSSVVDTNFWGSNAVGTGTIVPLSNLATMRTGTGTNSSVTLCTTRTARFVSGHTNYFFGVIRAPATTGTNTRRWGSYDASDGFFFEMNNNALALVCRKSGQDTRVSSGGFNGDAGPAYILSANAEIYEIHYTLKNAWFFIGGTLIHTFSGLDALLANNYSLPVSAENNNSGGNTASNTLEVRTAAINRHGDLNTEDIYRYIAASGTNVLKYSAGRLKRLVVNNPDVGAQIISLYDSTGVNSSQMAAITVPAPGAGAAHVPFSIEFGCPFFNGLTVVTTTVYPITLIYE